jgi:hypothetical protein
MGGNPQNEDFAETRLEVGLIKNKLEHLEESISEIKDLTKESILEVKDLLKAQGKHVPLWGMVIAMIPATLMAFFLLIMTVLIYEKFGG